MSSHSDRSLSGKQNEPIEESTEGITLLSDASDESSDSEDSNQVFHSVIEYQEGRNPSDAINQTSFKSKKATQNNEEELIFEPTQGHSSSGSQNNSNQNEVDEKFFENRNKNLSEISYNDTLSYLQDILGQTYLNNLSKNSVIQEPKHLPPKIESSSTCIQNSNKADLKNQKTLNSFHKLNQKQQKLRPQKGEKVAVDEKINPFSKKAETKQVPFSEERYLVQKKEIKKNKKSKEERKEDKKVDLSTNKSVSRIKRKEEGRDKSATKTVEHKRETRNKELTEEYKNEKYKQKNVYPYQNCYQSNQQHPQYLQYLVYSPQMGYSPYQGQMPPYYNYKKHPQQRDEVYWKQSLYNGPGHYYIPKNKRKKQKQQRDYKEKYQVINGWYYPNRGNLMYDRQERPWVVNGQMSIQDRYFAELMKKQYLTNFQRESLARYMEKRNHYSQYASSISFYPTPYEYPPNMNSFDPYDVYQQSNSLSEPSNNSQISTKTTPLNPKARNHDNSIREHPANIQPKVNEVKVASKQQSVKMKPPEEARTQSRQEYACKTRQQAPQKYRPQTTQSQKIPSKILPTDIMKYEPFLQQPKQQQQVGIIKEMSKPSEKSQIFVLYNIPVIISNQEVKEVSAEIYLVPYTHLMIQENHPSKWIEYIQKLTGIEIMKKLTEMNMKEVRENGRDIPEGTLSKIKLNKRINFFSSMYFIKLTNFIDAQSKKPHGQVVLKDAISKIVETLMEGNGNKSESTLLIHGGYFPGVQRELAPKLIANFMYVALANASLEYRNMIKGIKIIVNVPKQHQYYEYTKYFRKILNQYRKLQAI